MISIWKLESDSWVLIQDNIEESNLSSALEDLRQDGSEYRAEIRIESTSSILEV